MRLGNHGRRFREGILALGVGVVLAGCSSGESGTGGGAPSSPAAAAAQRGIEWMVAHADEMPPGWAHPFLSRLYRAVPDEQYAALIAAGLLDDSAPSRRVALPANLDDASLLHPARLTPILFELRRRKTVGEPYQGELEALARNLERSGERQLWPRLNATQRGVYLHQFADLGLATPYDFADLYRDIRAQVESLSPDEVATHPPTLYALTHLVLVKSRYFREFVDPEPFAFALPYFRRALELNLAGEPSHRGIDLATEVLFCLSLMRHPPDEHVVKAREIVVTLQNPEGSWGRQNGMSRSTAHASLNSVLALIELPASFRPDLEWPAAP